MIQIWCDVGGTFTDCFAIWSNGLRKSTKVLSSGITKGRIERLQGPFEFVDTVRCQEPCNFWVGATVRLLDRSGKPILESRCVQHDPVVGILCLESPIPSNIQAIVGDHSIAYELIAGIEAPVLATRILVGVPLNQTLPPVNVRLGTTRGTNALLTRKGASTALLTTLGFRDILRIGYQERPDLFTLDVKKREPLYTSVVEIEERLAADGSIITALNEGQARESLRQLRQQGVQSLAICLMHGYRYPSHEQNIQRWAQEAGFQEISTSSEIAPMIKLVSRAETTVVDAYLGPVVRDYLARVSEQFGNSNDSTLRVMTSHGGLVDRRNYRGKDCVLSGPAGGAVAVTKLAKAAGHSQVIGLDMGGTSTDVCRIAGAPNIEHEAIKAGVRLLTPMLAIHTVAAGGGSICGFDGVQWQVGPQSAGADPGPACYGRGGPLTITDLNLLLGRVTPSAFPFPLDYFASRQKLAELAQCAGVSNDDSVAFELVAGLRRIANEHMASAVRSISIAQGADPRDHILVGFGGAAGQHICEIAAILQIDIILDPSEAGLLSALGMGLASITRWASKGIYRPLKETDETELVADYLRLQQSCLDQLADENIASDRIMHSRTIELRYTGTDQTIALAYTHFAEIGSSFSAAHRQRFGYDRIDKSIELVALRVESVCESENSLDEIQSSEIIRQRPHSINQQRLYSDGAWHQGWSIDRDALQCGDRLVGPGIVLSNGSTTVVDRGWSLEALSNRTLKLHRIDPSSSVQKSQVCDTVLREVLAQRIGAIADSMGIVLEQTAMSVNIKERRDFSCAVFSSKGDLIANAPHVPVHLGAMSETVKQIIDQFPLMEAGDCFITNDPYRGGSHLPDVTVITPVYSIIGERMFFTANRAHHAEIGGLAPGSMSPLTTCLEEEGVILHANHLVRAGQDCSAEIRRILTTARYPTRAVDENMADLSAQQAANRRGEQFLHDLVNEYSWSTIEAYLEHIQAASELKVVRWIETYGSQVRSFVDSLDDGTPIAAKLIFDSGRLTIDMTGTGSVSKGNFNANPAIVSAAVLYVIRTMIDDELPLNSGALRPITLIVPPGLLNAYQPDRPLHKQPAVAAGNVETSQRVVDCLLGALEVAGASQGTMNNFLMGNSSFGYYETLGGGAGATRTSNGADAVHTHMTNTRLTDPEILESRYPVRLTRFEIRHDSGGAGLHTGGEGMHREMLMLEDLDVSLVTSRRGAHHPYGMLGGKHGAAGENYRIRLDGSVRPLEATCQIHVTAGERIGLKTPGGGGYGFQ